MKTKLLFRNFNRGGQDFDAQKEALETEFFSEMIKLSYGLPVQDKLKKISSTIPWAKGWPEDKEAFWNGEAFMWRKKIEQDKREVIGKELSFLSSGRNLDLGCGAYSYLRSTGFDLSEKMLRFNEKCTKKVKGDLEKELPFAANSFDSATAVFVLNYIQNYRLLLNEICRILTPKGIFVAILYSKKINSWQRQKEVHKFLVRKWQEEMEFFFPKIRLVKKDDLLFFYCNK